MKLIRCHIENFGCLNNFDYTFTDGLNILHQPNGFGKSTLAVFIKAMLYGLPRTGKAVLAKNERKRYYPWQRGRFGGFLEFEHGGTCYRVERFFGRTAAGDTFSLYDMTRRKESTRFGRDLGVELFHLDADSFQRSTYMPQQQGKIDFSTDSIRAKLSNLVEDTNDVNNYETAVEKLKSRRSYYQAYRGSGGRINELRDSIESLRSSLEKVSSLRGEFEETTIKLGSCEKRYAELCKNRDALQTRISALSTLEAEREKHNTFTRLDAETATIKNQLNELDKQYPAGYPSAEEIETFDSDSAKYYDACRLLSELKEPLEAKEIVQKERAYWEKRDVEADIKKAQDLLKDLNTADGRLQQPSVSKEEQAAYDALNNRFYNGVPDVAMRQLYLQKASDRSEKIAQRRSAKLSAAEQEKLERQRRFLGDPLPTMEELADYESSEAEIASFDEREKNAADSNNEEKKPFSKALPLLLGGAALLVGGIICLILSFTQIGAILAVAGAVLLALKFFGDIRARNASRDADVLAALGEEERERINALKSSVLSFYQRFFPDEGYRPGRVQEMRGLLISFQLLQGQAKERERQREELLDEIRILEQQLQGFLATYRMIPSDGDFRSALERLNAEITTYETLKKRLEQENKTRQELAEELKTLREQLFSLSASYRHSSDFPALPQHIRQRSNSYLNAKKELASYQENLARLTAQKSDLEKKLKRVLSAYQLTGSYRELARKMRVDKDERGRLSEKLRKAQKDLEQFLRKNPQAAKAPAWPQQEEIKSLGSLLVEREELDLEISRIERSQRPDLRRRWHELQQQLERLPRLQDRLERCLEEHSEATLARERLDKAVSYLEQAKTELSTGYVTRVEHRFRTYAQKLMGDEMGELALDNELDIRLEEGGETHELGYYSVGSIDSIMLCMHLALADTLFAGEPSFIILDDPFVNLDDKRTVSALALLEELSNTRQILYLVCNSSRSKFLP